jgi:exodeoxyribonuclease-5
VNDLNLSKTQSEVISSILDWFSQSKYQYITLGGYAGTGKTTILGHITQRLHSKDKGIRIAFCSFTGKASRVLDRKLKESDAVFDTDYIGTIHRLIYRAIVDENQNIIGWEKIPKEELRYSLIVVDEASMVTEDIWSDLLSFDIPILAVGDHGQLPPISSSFNLMLEPELKLEEIFRQEEGNPIIKFSEIARKYGTIPFDQLSSVVKKIKKSDEETQDILMDIFNTFDENTMILCGYNRTRINLNKQIRSLHFDSPTPQVGDRVICLKNNRNMDIYNGMTGTILDISKATLYGYSFYDTEISLDFEKEPFWGKISIEQFNSPTLIDLRREELNYFDYGYALTVHKAQGSQAKRVVLFEERFSRMDDQTYARWLYTAVTRAEQELYIIG